MRDEGVLTARLEHDDPSETAAARGGSTPDIDFDGEALEEAAKRGHKRAQYWLAQLLLNRDAERVATAERHHRRELEQIAATGNGRGLLLESAMERKARVDRELSSDGEHATTCAVKWLCAAAEHRAAKG